MPGRGSTTSYRNSRIQFALEIQPERSEYTEIFVGTAGDFVRKHAPYEVEAEDLEDIINTSAQLQVGFAIEGLESGSGFEIEGLVGGTQAAP